jgi:hypothetical protein
MANFSKVFKFSLAELFILLEAWFMFFKWDLLISFTQYKNWSNELECLHNTNDSKITSDTLIYEQVKPIIELSEIAGRFHFRKMNCLRRCISQGKILEKRGFKTCMHIGVRFDNKKLVAHAWLTFQGIVINDSEDVTTRYSELKSINGQEILRHFK